MIVEQAFLDLNLTNQINLRFGRVLTPLGITNWKHEPPSFNGVERPSGPSGLISSVAGEQSSFLARREEGAYRA